MYRMMVIMWFSGLRGAIAYALSLHLEFEEETRKVLTFFIQLILGFRVLHFSTEPFGLLNIFLSVHLLN